MRDLQDTSERMVVDPSFAEAARLELMDDGALLFHVAGQKLYHVDRPSAFVWSALEAAHGSVSEAAAILAEHSGVSAVEAAAFVAVCLEQWRTLDLLSGRLASPEATAGQTAVGKARPDTANLATTRYTAAGYRFEVAFDDDRAQAMVAAVMDHLQSTTGPADFAFCVRTEQPGYSLQGPGAPAYRLPDAEAVAVNLKNDMLAAILQRQRTWIALHGSALKTGDGALVLAGPSGSGKSTLGALLNAGGWPLIADDVLLLNPEGAIRGLAFAFAAKPESWPTLNQTIQQLEAIPVQVRPDGRKVKYIRPAEITSGEAAIPVRHIIFPTFQPTGDGALHSISRHQALTRLMEEGHNFDRRLTADGFSSLCRFIRAAETFTLAYPDPHRAADLIRARVGAEGVAL